MALSVTTASPGTISGVTTAQPTQSISGVSSASPGTISGVQSAPTTTSNYNPQGTSTSTPQAAAPATTLMPGTTSAQNVNQAPSPESPTFQLGDGSVYGINGQQVNPPTPTQPAPPPAVQGDVQTTSDGTSLTTPTPDTTQPSTSLENDTGYSDILSMLNQNLNNMDTLFSNMSQYSTVGAAEQAQQSKVASDQAAMTGLGYQAQGLYNPDNQNIALPFLTGQAQSKLVSAGIQSTLDQSVLNYMQGNRQFAFNSAATMYNAQQQGLETALDVYTKTAPQNVSTNYNPNTGQLTAIMRNPVTGATYTGNLGNIGAQQAFTSTSIQTDPITGALNFVGTTATGQIVQQPIGGGASYTSGGVSSPLSGSGSSTGGYVQTGTPQVSTAAGLLSNWTSGGTTTPGSGYQNAVYQTYSQMTGQQINAQTPTSTLVSNIPALAAGIAKAENISPALVAATGGNKWGIEYANQPGATLYTDPNNGFTYAKFDSPQDAQNAANNLIAQKLGASPTPAQPTPDLAQTVAQLPPALQGAVHYLPDGTPFFNANQLTSAQIPMAQAAATRTGIPYINGSNADKLDTISVAQQNLSQLSAYAQQTLKGGGVFGKVANIIQGSGVNAFFGSTVQTNFNTYRNLAISSLESLVGGTGSGLRITAGEIATQIDNLPSSSDTPGQAQTKVAALSSQMNKWIAQMVPGWTPSSSSALSTSGTPDYTATLNNLISAYSPQ